jgi:membrane protein DedA with SNARE-associated domain
MNFQSVIWVIAITLFFGGMGFPMPENPILLGGGYAVFRQISPPIQSLCLWYSAILLGDLFLFVFSYWFFTRDAISALLKRCLGKERLHRYQMVFACWGGLMLFLARFTFGIRAVAYVAAGAARYSWVRFLVVDGLSVAIQVLLFVGIGYYAGEKVELAKASGERIAWLLSIFALVSILVGWLSWACMQKLSRVALSKAEGKAGDVP